MLLKMSALKVGDIVVCQCVITRTNVENFESINGVIAFLFTLHCTNLFIITLLLVIYWLIMIERLSKGPGSLHPFLSLLSLSWKGS